MAKKKKSSKKKVAVGETQDSMFWPLPGRLYLIIAALFLLLGGFAPVGRCR